MRLSFSVGLLKRKFGLAFAFEVIIPVTLGDLVSSILPRDKQEWDNRVHALTTWSHCLYGPPGASFSRIKSAPSS